MNGEGVAQLRRELADLRTAKVNAENEAVSKVADLKAPLRKKLEAAEDERADITLDLARDIRTRDSLDALVKRMKGERETLLAEYRNLQALEFSGDTVCPVCGQEIPEDKLEAARGAFNEEKAKKLDENVKAGKALKADIEAKEAELEKTFERINKLQDDNTKACDTIRALEGELGNIRPVVIFDESAIAAKQAEIDGYDNSVAGRRGDINLEISRLNAQKSVHEQNLAAIQQAVKARKDIEDLKAREKDLSAQFEACERLIALCDDLTASKVSQLDTKISGAFGLVSWKLTETQVNGGLKEICDALIDGVPYSAANHAAQVNAGLDIIETFSRAYNVSLPIFIDNAESVTALNPMSRGLDRPQIIQLIVSAAHPSLTLEVL
jgi:chromosome segregation ATPase